MDHGDFLEQLRVCVINAKEAVRPPFNASMRLTVFGELPSDEDQKLKEECSTMMDCLFNTSSIYMTVRAMLDSDVQSLTHQRILDSDSAVTVFLKKFHSQLKTKLRQELKAHFLCYNPCALEHVDLDSRLNSLKQFLQHPAVIIAIDMPSVRSKLLTEITNFDPKLFKDASNQQLAELQACLDRQSTCTKLPQFETIKNQLDIFIQRVKAAAIAPVVSTQAQVAGSLGTKEAELMFTRPVMLHYGFPSTNKRKASLASKPHTESRPQKVFRPSLGKST